MSTSNMITQVPNSQYMGTGGNGGNGKSGIYRNGVFISGGNLTPVRDAMVNPNNGKAYYEPFKVVGPQIDPQVQMMQKSTENKDYYILYYNLEFEEYRWKKFTGRYDAYFGLQRILESESVDLEESIVLVETVGYSSDKIPRKFLTHPENAVNLIEFANAMEKYFGDNAWHIEEYNTGYTTHQYEDTKEAPDEPKEQETMTYEDLSAAMGKSMINNLNFAPTETPVSSEDFTLGHNANLFMSKEEREDYKDIFRPTNLLNVEGKEI